mgnify:CR=1 FL=1
MEFLVRSAERIPSPCCGKNMSVIGTRDRKSKDREGHTNIYNIRRLRCDHCRRIHHELPNFLVPYKRYESECIETVLSNPTHHDIPADDSTLFRWKEWFDSFIEYWIGCLISIMLRSKQGDKGVRHVPGKWIVPDTFILFFILVNNFLSLSEIFFLGLFR